MKFWKRQNYWDRNQISGCPGLWHPAGVIEMFCILIVVEQQGWIWLYQTPNKEKVQFSSVSQSCPTLCDPMDCSTPDFPVYYQLLESTHHVHWVSDVIQPSHPLSSPTPPTFNLSQHQVLFQWVSSVILAPNFLLWRYAFGIRVMLVSERKLRNIPSSAFFGNNFRRIG